MENGSFKWPRDESEVKPIIWQLFRWLTEGLREEQKQFVKTAKTGDYYNQLFKVKKSLKDLTFKERFCKRLELEKLILAALWCWLEALNVLKGSVLSFHGW